MCRLLSFLCLVALSIGHDVNDMDRGENFLKDEDVVQDQKHIEEHLDGRANIDFSKMSPTELEFYYFHIHDLDGNQSLDGLELISALEHSMYKKMMPSDIDFSTESGKDMSKNVAKYLEETVDNVLAEVDGDKDGYLTYAEFKTVKRHAHLMTWGAKTWAAN